ncbi:YqaJ viral recombinase family protein [Microbacterium sp. NPDC028030]|uniref:YqaJ viral recombinase family protein n=1 Tax=Microbacterium sp. NPDC028030 TaxID=3155124 RepID=UPI0033CB8228
MTVMESQALTDLLARAGAPDTDRPRWIAERMAGITATEVRDLATGKVRAQALIDMKLGRTPEPGDLSRIPIIGWGRDREVVIAEALRGVGIEPESRVFHGEHNSRHLASPDGVGVDFDDSLIVSEIKTSGAPLLVGSPELEAKGYVHQMQWVMHVTGAVRCRFVVEQRIQVKGGFVPGPLAEDWIERDDAAIAELIEIADAFLAELDRQREDGAPVIDEELDTHAVNYLRAIDEEKRWGDLKREHYAAVVAAGKSQESPLARITYTAEKPGEALEVEEIDYDAARATHFGQALFAELQSVTARWNEHLQGFISTKPVQGKGRAASARITAGKGTRS